MSTNTNENATTNTDTTELKPLVITTPPEDTIPEENKNLNEELSEYADIVAKQKKDTSRLPRIEAFRIDCGSGTGTAKTWHSTGYVLMLKPRGVKSFYTAGTVAAAHGMKCKWQFRLEMADGRPVEKAELIAYAKAKEAGIAIQRTWGRPGKKPATGKAKMSAAERVARAFAKLSDEDKKTVLNSAK